MVLPRRTAEPGPNGEQTPVLPYTEKESLLINSGDFNGLANNEAIEKMSDVEKSVLGLYYYEEMTLREIAGVMGLHESRISQLKSQAVLRLRSYMQKRWPQQGAR